MDDLEEVYSEGVEKEGEIFIEGLENKKSLTELEKQYSEKVKEIRKIYEKSLKKELGKEAKTNKVKTVKKKQKENEKEFHVQNLVLDESWTDKKEIEIALAGYKVKRRIKDLVQVIIPKYFIYEYYKIKRILKDFFKEIREFSERAWYKAKMRVLNVVLYIKEGLIKIITDIKKIANFFKRKNIKNKEGGKKDDSKTNTGKTN